MIRLTESLNAWNTESFTRTLKSEIEGLAAASLPLHLGTTQGGIVDDGDITVTVLRVSDTGDATMAQVGVFFKEIVGGCSCGDDPMSAQAYCELLVTLDRVTGEAQFVLASG